MVASNAVVVLVTATLGFGVMKAVAVVVVPRMAAADRRATSFMVLVRYGGERRSNEECEEGFGKRYGSN